MPIPLVRRLACIAALVVVALLVVRLVVHAATSVWDLSDPADYAISDPDRLEISGGVARLVPLDALDDDDSATGFGGGTHSQTQWNATSSRLELAPGQTSGTFTSRVFDAERAATWSGLAWTPDFPYAKPLPDGAATESAYASGNADMSGNRLLLHLDESVGTLSDGSGSGNHGIAVGAPTYSAVGKIGTALQFDGVDDAVDCGDDASLDLTGDLTLEAWIGEDGPGRPVGDLGSELDTLAFDAASADAPAMLRISEEHVLIAYAGPDGDGFAVTVEASDAGTLGAIVDSLEFDVAAATNPSLTAVSGTTYAVAYTGASGAAFVKSFSVESDGTMSDFAIDALQFDAGGATDPVILSIVGDVFAIAYEDTDGHGEIATIRISSIGFIDDTVLDRMTFDAVAGAEPCWMRVDTSVFAIAYRGSADSGRLVTVSIDAAGAIADTPIDTATFHADGGDHPSCAPVAGDVFAIVAGRPSSSTTLLTTYSILSNGTLGTTPIDQLDLGVEIEHPDLVAVARAAYLVAGRVSGAASLRSYEISDTGTITTTAIDTGTFDATDASRPTILRLGQDAFAVAFRDASGAGRLSSIEIIARRGVFKGDAFGIDRSGDRAFAWIDGVTLDAAASGAGLRHVAMTYDATSDTLRLFVDGALASQATVADGVGRSSESFVVGRHVAGPIDEVALFARALSAAEIDDHYRRGAVRARFQIRRGSSNPPAGAFVGPDDTSATFYDESTEADLGLPVVDLTPGSDTRYFQYQVVLESDTSGDSPELASVAITPLHYTASRPSITSLDGIGFATLRGFTETLGGQNAGTLTYQLSRDATTWYWFDGGSWTPASSSTEANPASVIDLEAASFHEDVGSGTLYFRAFFYGDAAEDPVELSEIEVETTVTAELTVGIAVDDATPVEGQAITYTVTVHNAGPDYATGLVVADPLPVGLTFSSAAATQGSYAAGSGAWTVGDLADGVTATLTLGAVVDAGVGSATLTNSATVQQRNEADSDGSDDSASIDVVVQSADLQVTKSGDVASPNVGDTVTFTVQVTNAGPDAATGVAITDLLPSGLSFSSSTVSQGSYHSGTGVWSLGTVADSATETLTIAAVVEASAAGQTVTNTASVTAVEPADPSPGDEADSASMTVLAADLAVSVSVDDATPNEGQTVTFTVIVSNAGPDDATQVVVSDMLPAGLSFASASATQGSYSSGTGLWDVGSVADGAAATLTLMADVDAGTGGTTITNTAAVDSVDQADPSTGDESDGASITVLAADLGVGVTVDDATPTEGQSITFVVTLTNHGPDAATDVEVTDLLPAGLTFSSASPSTGSYVSGTGVWTLGTVAASAVETLSITAIVDAATTGSTLTNTATVSQAGEADPVAANDSDSVSLDILSADLAVGMGVSTSNPRPDQTVRYTVTITNLGPDATTDVDVLDALPTGLTFVSASGTQGAYDDSTGIWDVGALADGAGATLTIDATVEASAGGQTLTNTASVAGSSTGDPVSSNDSASVDIVVASADLGVLVAADDATPDEGQTVIVTVTVSNAGPEDATNVEIDALLPASLGFVSATASQGSYANGSGVWIVGSIADGANATLDIHATVQAATAGMSIDVTASVRTLDEADLVSANDTDTVQLNVRASDLGVSLVVDEAAPDEGDAVTFTVTLTNDGPDAANDVEILSLLPTGLTFVSATPTAGSYTSGSGVWDVGALAASASETLTLQATVDAGTGGSVLTQVVSISSVVEGDPVTGNDSDSVDLTVASADVGLAVAIDDATPDVGDTIQIVVTATNHGPQQASGVQITAALPAGLTFDAAVASAGSYDSGTGVWTTGAIADQAAPTLTIDASVDAGRGGENLRFDATITQAASADPDSSNDAAGVDVEVRGADLGVTTTASTGSADEGDTVEFTVTVANAGPDDASGVSLSSSFTAGVTFQAATASQGSFDDGTGVWTIGSLSQGVSATLTIEVTVDAGTGGSAITHTVAVASVDEEDPDPTDDTDQAVLNVKGADLGIALAVDDATPREGDSVTYTVTLSNAGPSDATNIVAAIPVPGGASFASATPSQGSYNDASGEWTVGAVADSASATLTLVVTIDEGQAAQTVTANASITAVSEADPVSGNDADALAVTVESSDLQLSLAVDEMTPDEGATIRYTVTIDNLGPNDAAGVGVDIPLPSGTTFVSATPSRGSYSSGTGVWSVGALANAASATLQLDATVDAATAGATLTATASVSDTDQGDPVSGNDSASVAVTVTSVDLGVSMSVDDATPDEGDTLTYTITLSNAGPDEATGIQVTDLLPTGLTFVSDTASQGSYNDGTGVWDVGTLANGAGATLTLVATVDAGTAGQTLVNSVTVSTVDQGGGETADDSDSVSIVVASADLRVRASASDTAADEGQTLTITFRVANLGPNDTTGVELGVAVPTGLTYVSNSASLGTYDSGNAEWSIGALSSGIEATLTLTVTVDAGTSTQTLDTVGTLTASDRADPVSSNDSATASVVINGVDLSVTVTVDDGTPPEEGTIQYVVTVSNAGPDTASGIEVTDLLPTGLAFETASPSQGTYAFQTGVWDVGSLLSGDDAVLTIEATVDTGTAGTTITNTATVTDVVEADSDGANDQDSVDITVSSVDLGVSVSADVAHPDEGDSVVWTITVSNTSDGAGTGVSATVTLPTGVTFATAVPSQGSYDNGTGAWTIGDIDAAGNATLAITTTVDAGTASQTLTVNAAITAMDQPDPAAGNDSASDSVDVAHADVSIGVVVDDATPDEGQSVVYTVTVTNQGPQDQTSILVTDALPSGVSYSSDVPSQGVYDSSTGSWTVGDLSASASATLAITVGVDADTAGDTITNTTSVTSVGRIDTNASNDTASVDLVVADADLETNLTVDNATADEGATVTFTLQVTNNGPTDTTGVEVQSLLPTGFTFVSATPAQGTYDDTTGTWTVGSILDSASTSLQWVATIDAGTAGQSLVHSASISASDRGDSTPGNDQDSVSVTVSGIDLGVSITVDDPTPLEGGTVQYTVTVSNLTVDGATGVEVAAALPPGLTYASHLADAGTWNLGTGVWSLGAVAGEGSETLTITATVDAGTSGDTITYDATITDSDRGDTDSANDSASVDILVESPDLGVTLAVDDATPRESETVTFTVTLTNHGPADATGVEVTCALPAGLTYASDSPGQGTYASGSGVWSVGSLSASSNASLVITATVDAGTMGSVLSTTALISDHAEPDPVPSNDADSVGITVEGAELAIGASVDDTNPTEGDTITWTVTLDNNGPENATGVAIAATIPAGLTFVSAVPSVGSYDDGSGVWTVGTLANAGSGTLVLTMTVDAGSAGQTIAAVAAVSASDQGDPVAANDSASVEVVVRAADLAVSISVDDANPTELQTVSLTVQVTNSGPESASSVAVSIPLPAGLTYVSDTPSQGTYVSGTGVWTVGTLANTASATLVVQATVDAGTTGQTFVPTATRTASSPGDSDSSDDTDSVSIVVDTADLAVGLSVDDGTPAESAHVTFTLVVTNEGPADATGVVIDDVLPAGLTFVSATPSAGTYDSGTGAWTVGSLALDTAATLVLVASVDLGTAGTTITNAATVAALNQSDPDPSDDTDSVSLVVEGGARIASGRYIGDGTSARAISGLGFAPDVVLVKSAAADLAMIRTSTMSAGEAKPMVGSTAPVGSRIESLDGDGFTIGNANEVNAVGTEFHWVAMAGAPTELAVGSYVGDGAADRTIDAPGLNPGWVLIASEGAHEMVHRVASLSGDATLTFGTDTPAAGRILSLESLGFRVSDDATVNATGETYHWIALRELSGRIDVGSYAGDGSDARAITDPGFRPEWVLVKSEAADEAVHRSASQVGDTTAALGAYADRSDAIETLRADGFEVGTSDVVNRSATTQHYVALRSVAGADLEVFVSVDDAAPDVGDTVRVTVRVENHGPEGTTGVAASVTLPTGVTESSASADQGTYDSPSGAWTIGSLAVDATATLTIDVTVDPGTANQMLTVLASLSATDVVDAHAGNDAASIGLAVNGADVEVGINLDVTNPDEGDLVTYTITASNHGPNDASGVVLDVPLGAGLTYASDAPSQGSYDSASGSWTVGALASSTSATLTLSATVDAGTAADTIATSVSIGAMTEADPVGSNDTDSASLTVRDADLRVRNRASNATPVEGELVTYVVRVKNLGPDATDGVEVTDLVPAGVTFVAATPDVGTYDSGTGVWQIGALANGAKARIFLDVTVDAATAGQTIVNTATVTASDTGDSVASNNTNDASITVESADVAVTITANTTTPDVGDVVTFTVTASNGGPQDVTNLFVDAALASGLAYAGATPSQGTYDPMTGVWNVSSLANGASATLTLLGTIRDSQAGNTITQTAARLSSDQGDSNESNDSDEIDLVVRAADLALTATADDTDPVVGESVTLTFAVANAGPDDATNARVFVGLPIGLTYQSATPSQGSYDAGSNIWTVGSLADGGGATLAVVVVVAAGTETDTLTASATTLPFDQGDPDASNNADSVSVTVRTADLSLAMTVDDSTPNIDDTVRFSIVVSNLGPDTTGGVEVTDVLPADLSFVAATPTQGSYDSGTGVWTVGTLANAATATLLLDAAIASDAQGKSISNAAAITSAEASDLVSANNDASVTLDVHAADLAVSIAVDDSLPNEGDTVTFTVTVLNRGPDAASSLVVAVPLPSGLSFVSASPTSGSYDDSSGDWTVGALAASASESLTLVATIDAATAGQSIVTQASVSSVDQGDPTSSDTVDSVTVAVQSSDLQVTKTVDDAHPNAGDIVDYTVVVANHGPDDATGIAVTDNLPTGVSFVAASASQGSYAHGTGIWSVGSVVDGASATLTISVRIDADTSGDTITNTAAVSAVDQADPSMGQESDSASLVVQGADVAISASVDDPIPDEGGTVAFTIRADNLGPDTATQLVVGFSTPSGMTFASAVPGQGSYDAGTGVWTVGSVAASTGVDLVVQATVDAGNAGSTLAATASITSVDQDDPVAGNDSDSVSVTVAAADLDVALVVDESTPDVGGTLTYTITVSNGGPQDATGVVVTDLLPSGLTFQSATASQGSYVSGSGAWTVGTLANTSAATLDLVATVDAGTAGQTLTNTAAVTAADRVDPDASNDSASVGITVSSVDLSLTKTVDDATPEAGDTIRYTIAVLNSGPDDATGIEVTDVLPAEVTFSSASASVGSYDDATGVWDVGALVNSASATLTIDVVVDAGAVGQAIDNTATITASGEGDPDVADRSDTAAIVVGAADLSIVKTVSDAEPAEGATIIYTVVVTNDGPQAATSVRIVDVLPTGVAYVSESLTQGTYAVGTGEWTVGTIVDGATATMTLTCTVDERTAGQTITNTAAVAESIPVDPDPSGDSDDATLVVRAADLAIVQTVSDPSPTEGDTVTLTTTLTNEGPNATTGITARVTVPAGLSFVSAAPGQGSFDDTTGLWTVGDLANAAQATLTLQVTVDAATRGQSLVTLAAVETSATSDPDASNDSDSATATVQAADLSVTLATDDYAGEGETVVVTTTLSNLGPEDATGIVVEVPLPTGLTFVSATPSAGTYDSMTGDWSVASLANASSATLAITATVDASTTGQTLTVAASITASLPGDSDAANDSDSIDLQIEAADLAVIVSVDDGSPEEGESVAYTIEVSNAGPDATTEVLVDAVLPAGLTFSSVAPSQGTYDAGTGRWTVGSLASDAAETLQLTAIADGGTNGTELTLPVSIAGAAHVDPDTSNDADSVMIRVGDELRIATGEYAGDGTDARAITGLAFEPDFVLIKAESSAPAVLRTATLSGDAAKELDAAGAVVSDRIESLDSDGFTVGTAASVNASGVTYRYVAMQGARTRLEFGSYVGDGTDERSIEEPHFEPDWIVVFGEGATAAVHRFGLDAGDATRLFGSGVAQPNRIEGTEARGFRLGSDDDVNAVGVTYHTILARSAASYVGHGSYTGDGTSGRSISNALDADWLLVQSEYGHAAVHRTASMRGDETLHADGAGDRTDAIVSLDSTGFTVGADDHVNAAATVYSWMAWEASAGSDIRVDVSLDDTRPTEGDTVTFEIDVTSRGADAASGVVVDLPIPAGLTVTGSTPAQGTFDPGTGTWTIGTLSGGASTTLDVVATVDAATGGQTIALAAAVTSMAEIDDHPGNDADSTELVVQIADIAVVKTTDHATPTIGEVFHYTIQASNAGPHDADSVVVTDVLPANLTLRSASPSSGTYDGGSGAWAVGTIDSGATATLTLEVEAEAAAGGQTITNTASLTSSGVVDTNAANDSSSVDIEVIVTDLGLAMAVDDTTPDIGDSVTFTVTLSNNSTSASTGVEVTDVLPSGLAFSSASTSHGAYDDSTGVWSVASLGASQNASLTLVATVTPGTAAQTLTNTATITASEIVDVVPGNDVASQTVTIVGVDIAIAKSVSDATPNEGEPITWTIVATNHGPDGATGVVVGDPLPAGLTLQSSSATIGTYDGGTGAWTIGALAPNGSATLTLTTTTDPGTSSNTIVNTSSLVSVAQEQTSTANDADSASIVVQGLDLAVSVAADRAIAEVGETIRFTVTATNLGPWAASGVEVTDLLPDELLFLGASPSEGTYVYDRGTWTLGTLGIGVSETLVIDAAPLPQAVGTDVINTAIVTGLDQYDTNAVNDYDEATVTVRGLDLALSMSVNDSYPSQGQLVTFTLTLTNEGPYDASGIHVQDALPSGLTISSAVGTAGRYDGEIWIVDSLADGASEMLYLGATVDFDPTTDTALHEARITGADQGDVDATNDVAAVRIGTDPSILSVQVLVDEPNPEVGDWVTFTVRISNTGTIDATGVEVLAKLPPAVSLVSALPDIGSFDPGIGAWTGISLVAGANRALDLVVEVDPGAEGVTLRTFATLDRSVPSDGDASDDRGEATAYVEGVEGWIYERVVTLENAGPETLTDHPVLLTLTTAQLGSPYEHVTSDGSGLRFRDGGETRFFDYWIESWDPEGTSRVWVSIPSIPPGTSEFVLLSGRADAHAASDGLSTFVFFDDFEDDVAGKAPYEWTRAPGSEDVVVVDAFGNRVLTDGAGEGGGVVAGDPQWSNVAVQQRFRSLAATGANDDSALAGVLLRHQHDGNTLFGGVTSDTTAEIRERTDGAWTTIGGPWTIPDLGLDWHVQELRAQGTELTLWIDHVEIGSATSTSGPLSGRAGFWTQEERQGDRDDHVVRILASQEPEGTVGASKTALCGLYDPTHGVFFLLEGHRSGNADTTIRFGPQAAGFLPLYGDWNGDGIDTPGLYDPAHGVFFLRNSNTRGGADLRVRFGPSGAGFPALVGDWNGDGIDTVGLYDPVGGVFYLRNSNTRGNADINVRFGPRNAGWEPIVGDWDGDGITTVGLVDPSTGNAYLRNTNSRGNADLVVVTGALPSDRILVGDWGGNGQTTLGIYEEFRAEFRLRNDHSRGDAHIRFRFGPRNAGWLPLVGDWDPR